MTVATTFEVTMPQLGETVAEGTVTAWLKQVGDPVEQDEALVEIATDKVDTEVPSPASGVLVQVLVDVDQTVPVGTPIALLDIGGGPVTGPPPATDAPIPAAQPSEPVPTEVPPTQAPPPEPQTAPGAAVAQSPGPRHRASPRVRRHAAERGIDLGALAGTGPGGRVTLVDVAASGNLATEGHARSDTGAGGWPGSRHAQPPVGAIAGVVTGDLELPATVADRRELLATMIVGTLATLRRYTAMRDVLISRSDGEVGIATAADLTATAVAARLAESRTDEVHAPLRVVDADGVRSQFVSPRGDEVAVLAIGERTEGLVPRGQATFALRATVTVTLAYTDTISDVAARAVLVALGQSLAEEVG